MGLLDRTVSRILSRLRLVGSSKTTGVRAGHHRSEVLAQGLEFADHRPYAAGDDIRRIDWKAFARHRQLTVRIFEEERDLRVHLLLDVSNSMSRGEPPKIELSRTVAAAFTRVAVANQDRISVTPFAEGLVGRGREASTPPNLMQVEEFLSSQPPAGATEFGDAVRAFATQRSRPALVVIVSDLMHAIDWETPLRSLARQGHRLCVVRVGCEEDDRPQLRGELELYDAESDQRMQVTVTKGLLDAYANEVRTHIHNCRRSCHAAGAEFVELDAATPSFEAVRRALQPVSVLR
jgi:uncharacterized protein (DUF58 family)